MANESGFRRVFEDVTDLAELQMQLLAVGSQEAKRRATTAVIASVLAAVVGLASITTLLLCLGWTLHEFAGWPVSLSMLVAGGAGLLIAGIAAWVGYASLQRAVQSMEEPKREFAENLRWLKGVILTPETSARNQLRKESFANQYASASASGEPTSHAAFNSRRF